MTEGYHHSNGNPLAVLFWSEKFPARRLPRQKPRPKVRRYSQIFDDFQKISGAGKFKNPIWPPEGPELAGAWLWPSPRPGSSPPPLPFFFPFVITRLPPLSPFPIGPGSLSALDGWPNPDNFGLPPPVRGNVGFERFLSRGRVVAVQNHFARKSLFFRKSVASFVRYLEDFGENRCDIVRHRAVFSSQNGGFG